MDKILMNGMMFYGYHGVLEEEKELGQRFIVDVILYTDLKKAGKTDNLDCTVNYKEVYETIKRIVEDERYNLLEALAERICEDILRLFGTVLKVNVKIKKPETPVAGIFDYFAVQIERERDYFNE
ncbi:MAG: dihydroneopterin aldolase [Natronincolaceae bacterium]|nr:dihydroneopterin aldolase [Bacillota bacterium]NLK90936.1 dihydroneopterin aldolase [Clostridiales bacterium]